PYRSLVEYPTTTLFHPLFLYESLWSVVAFIVLLNVFLRFRHRLLPGDILLMYLVQYSLIRFLLEGIRVEVTLVGTVNFSQVLMAVVFIISLGILIYRHRPGAVHTRSDQSQQTAV